MGKKNRKSNNNGKQTQDLQDDNSRPKLRELRKTKLTLSQINKIRRMQEVRKFEYDQKLKNIRQQYAPPAPVPGL